MLTETLITETHGGGGVLGGPRALNFLPQASARDAWTQSSNLQTFLSNRCRRVAATVLLDMSAVGENRPHKTADTAQTGEVLEF